MMKHGPTESYTKPLSYDESIELTINKNYGFGRNMMYQNISFLIMSMGILSANPV